MESYIEINHKLIIENYKLIKSKLTKSTLIMAVVKSNAYGHGMEAVSETLEPIVDRFGVTDITEATRLRKSGIAKDILIMGPTYDFQNAAENDLTISIESFEQLEKFKSFIDQYSNLTKVLKIHIKLNTGMNRFGFVFNELTKLIEELRYLIEYPTVNIEGIFSHIACLKNVDAAYIGKQKKVFDQSVNALKVGLGKPDLLVHLANSETAIDFPDMHYDMVRIGNGLFGPIASQCSIGLKQASSLYIPVVSIHKVKAKESIGYGRKYYAKKELTIAIGKIGYYEGFGLEKVPIGQSPSHQLRFYIRRLIKGVIKKEFVIYNETALPIIGMVNMQYIQVDIGQEEIKVGDYFLFNKAPLYIKESVERKHLLEA